jgi:hypothetical protein
LRGERRLHHHAVTGGIVTSPHGIALASNGAATGYAQNGNYSWSADTDDQPVELPYLTLLQCEKR